MDACETYFKALALDAKDYYVPSAVEKIKGNPCAIDFLRQWVTPNIPVIFKQAVSHWPAVKKWSSDYLRQKIGKQNVTVAVTPNGYADAVCNGYFVKPEERQLSFETFLNIIEGKDKDKNGVFYIQKQNSNFTTEFKELHGDAELEIAWASEAFGKSPDAVNFWMGEKAAVTSLHKDHYENIYCVISGTKTFTLFPPTDLPWIPYENFCSATYKLTDGSFEIMKDEENLQVPWIPIDVLNPDLEKYPAFSNATPLSCTVEAGDAFYLPSLWYHHVQQSHGCISVNFWYDMEFDCKYVYHKFLENVSRNQNVYKYSLKK